MKISKKKLEDGSFEVTAKADAKEATHALDTASIVFMRRMGIQPVANKTPAQVASERLGIDDLDAVVSDQAIEALIPFALDKAHIVPAVPPKAGSVSKIKRDQPLAFTFRVVPKPDYELSSYEPVSIAVRRPPVADDAAIKARIDEILEPFGKYVDNGQDRPIKKGDDVFVAIEAQADGKLLGGLSTPGRTYSVGQGFMPEGFDEGIIGMRVGETKSFEFEGPDVDEQGNETMMAVSCTVTLREIQAREKPELTDDFVKENLPQYRDAADMRKQVTSEVMATQEAEYTQYLRQMAALEVEDRFEGRIDDAVYEAMREKLMGEVRQAATAQGATLEQFIEQQGGQQSFSISMMMQIRGILVQGYCLDAIFRHEGLAVTEEDIEDICKTMLPPPGSIDPMQRLMGNVPTVESVRQSFERNGQGFVLMESAERLRANKWLVEHAKISYVD